MARRERYTQKQLEQYFDRVSLPTARRVYDVSQLDDDAALAYLNLLQRHQLCKVPWENLVQHYSWHHVVHLEPQYLFRKIVHQPGVGGYCMEANFFFHLILYSSGFQVYMAGSRIYKTDMGLYGGWTHVVNIVTIAGKKYLLDGGFGGTGPTRPLLIEHDVPSFQTGPAQLRLVHESIPNHLDKSQKAWVCQHRYDSESSSKWRPLYCFLDLEFTPEDIESMNYTPSMSRHTFFTHKVVCVRFTTDREVDSADGPGSPDEEAMAGKIDGSLTINHGTLKWRRNGMKILDIAFKSEQERVEALWKYFGIHLTDEDRAAIFNTAAMIGVKAITSDD